MLVLMTLIGTWIMLVGGTNNTLGEKLSISLLGWGLILFMAFIVINIPPKNMIILKFILDSVVVSPFIAIPIGSFWKRIENSDKEADVLGVFTLIAGDVVLAIVIFSFFHFNLYYTIFVVASFLFTLVLEYKEIKQEKENEMLNHYFAKERKHIAKKITKLEIEEEMEKEKLGDEIAEKILSGEKNENEKEDKEDEIYEEDYDEDEDEDDSVYLPYEDDDDDDEDEFLVLPP